MQAKTVADDEAESGGWLVMCDLVDGSGIGSRLGERGEEGWGLNKKRAEWAAKIRSARPLQLKVAHATTRARVRDLLLWIIHRLGTYMRYLSIARTVGR